MLCGVNQGIEGDCFGLDLDGEGKDQVIELARVLEIVFKVENNSQVDMAIRNSYPYEVHGLPFNYGCYQFHNHSCLLLFNDMAENGISSLQPILFVVAGMYTESLANV